MEKIREFDFTKVDFAKNKYLIEASAGTGKTHSMSQIFIRLILEGYQPDKILLVTFTNSAADEIKERLLSFLVEVRKFLIYKDKNFLNKIKNDNLLLDYLTNLTKDTYSNAYKNISKNNDLLLEKIENAIFLFDKISVLTIHSFAIRLCKEFSNELNLPFEYDFFKNTDKVSFVIFQRFFIANYKKIISLFSEKEEKTNFKSLYENVNKIRDFYENHRIGIDDLKQEEFEYLNYLKNAEIDLYTSFLILYILESLNLKKKYGLFNFSDSIELLLKFLKDSKNNKIKENISIRFDVLIVDEFQDTDEKQVELFELLFENKLTFYIGDPKQSIYGFRGGDLINYLKVKKRIKDECIFNLSNCYRSTEKVIEFINNFSDEIYNEQKDILGIFDISYNPVKSKTGSNENESEAYLYKLNESFSSENEYDYLVTVSNIIKNKILQLSKSKTNFKYEDVAILFKSKYEIMNFYKIFSKIQDAQIKIPIALKIATSIFSTEEALFVYFLLRAILFNRQGSAIRNLVSTNYFSFDFDSIVNNFDKIFDKIYPALDILQENWKRYGIYSVFETIFIFSNNILYGFNPFTRENFERKLTNIRQIFEILTYYFENRNYSLYNQFEFFQNLLLGNGDEDEDQENMNSMRLESEENAVLVSTIHSAKGLEYEVVFLPKFKKAIKYNYPEIYYSKDTDNIAKKYVLDSEKAKEKIKIQNNYKDYQVEIKNFVKLNKVYQDKNLKYVAITRAKKNLFLFLSLNEKDKTKSDNKNENKANVVSEIDYYKIFNKLDENKLVRYDHNLSDIKNEIEFQNQKFSIEIKEEKLCEIEQFDTKDFDEKKENLYSYSSLSHLKNKINQKKESTKNLLDYVIEFNPYKVDKEADFEEKYSDFKGKLAGNIFHTTMEILVKDYPDIYNNPLAENKVKIKKLSEEIVSKYYKSPKIIEEFSNENVNLVINTLNAKIPVIEKKICQVEEKYAEVEFFAKAKEKSITDFYNLCGKKLDKLVDIDYNQLKIKGFYTGFIDLIFIADNKIHFLDYKTNDLTEFFENNSNENSNENEENKVNSNILEKAIAKSNYDIQYYLYSAAIYKYLKTYKIPYEFGNIYYCFVRYMKENSSDGIFFKNFSIDELERLSNELIEDKK